MGDGEKTEGFLEGRDSVLRNDSCHGCSRLDAANFVLASRTHLIPGRHHSELRGTRCGLMGESQLCLQKVLGSIPDISSLKGQGNRCGDLPLPKTTGNYCWSE